MGQFSPRFGVIFLPSYTVDREKQEKNPLEKIQKRTVETVPRNQKLSVACRGVLMNLTNPLLTAVAKVLRSLHEGIDVLGIPAVPPGQQGG